MNQKQTSERLFLLICIVLALASVGYCGLKTIFGGLWMVDIETYWKNTAYAIRGYRLEDVAHGAYVSESVGMALGSAIVMPWGRLFANLIYPGFLSLSAACVYYYLLMAVCAGVSLMFVIRFVREAAVFQAKAADLILAISLFLMPLYWDDAIDTGNMGGILCLLLVMALFLMERHPIFAGFLLAICCLKPQNIGLFLLVLLLQKRWKALFSAGGFALAGWGANLIYIRIASFLRSAHNAGQTAISDAISDIADAGSQGVSETAGAGAQIASDVTGAATQGGYQAADAAAIVSNYASDAVKSSNDFFMYGIFTKMMDYGWSTYMVLALSALLGIAFVVGIHLWLKGTKYENSLMVGFAAAALGSIFWCYKTPCDEIIMILCNLLVVLFWKESKRGTGEALWCAAYLAALNLKVFRFFGRKLIPSLELSTAITLDMVLRIVVFASMIAMLRKMVKGEKRL